MEVIEKKKYIYINNVKNKFKLKEIFEDIKNNKKFNYYIILYNTKYSSIHLSIKSLNYLFQIYDISTNVNLAENDIYKNEIEDSVNSKFYLIGPLSNDYILNYETNFIDYLLET